MEFHHNLGRPLTDGEVLAHLRSEYPDKDFSIGAYGEIIESYREPMVTAPTRAEALQQADDLRQMREAMVGYGAVEFAYE
jgi:hypothetical protein